MTNNLKIMTGVMLTAGLLACSSTESDWSQAQTTNTAGAYQHFLQQHPGGPHTQEAHDRLQTIADAQAWADAQRGNTLEAYQQYLQNEPMGAHIQDAKAKVTSFERAAAWTTARSADTEPGLQSFLQKYSMGAEADQARAQLQKLQSEGFRVQLESFAKRTAAEQSLDHLTSRFSAELRDLSILPPSGTEKRFRVASVPMTEADAKSACTELERDHQRCEVVQR